MDDLTKLSLNNKDQEIKFNAEKTVLNNKLN